MSLPPSLRIREKVEALLWVPDGEVDDTRFEKLHDELEKLIQNVGDLSLLLSFDFLATLETSLGHVDERIRAIAVRLLGALSVLHSIPPTQLTTILTEGASTSLGLVSHYLQKHCTKETLRDIDPLEIEAICFCASKWIPHLLAHQLSQTWLIALLQSGISSASHFVRQSALKLFEEACNMRLESTTFEILEFVFSMDQEAKTALDLLTIVTETLILSKIGKPAHIEFVMQHLESEELVVAESARRSLRSLIHCCPCLLEPTENINLFLERVSAIVEGLISRNKSSSLKAAISLLTQPSTSTSNAFSRDYYAWTRVSLLRLLGGDATSSITTGFHRLEFQEIFQRHRELVTDQILGILLKIDRNTWEPSLTELTSIIAEEVTISLRQAHPSPTTSQAACKVFLLLKQVSIDGFTQTAAFHTLYTQVMSAINVPVQIKVSALQVIRPLAVRLLSPQPPDWLSFDVFLPAISAARFSAAWEVRDCVLQIFEDILTHCSDLDACIARNMVKAALMGREDQNEYVRATAWAILGQTSVIRKMTSSMDSTFPDCLVAFIDPHSIGRIAQLLALSSLLNSWPLEFSKSFVSNFKTLLDMNIADDDWEVRQGVLTALKVLPPNNERLYLWQQLKCANLLEQATTDESRLVRREAWMLVRNLRGNDAYHALDCTWRLTTPEEVEEKINSQNVDETYDPDDEVYPLAAGAADNDLDCPF